METVRLGWILNAFKVCQLPMPVPSIHHEEVVSSTLTTIYIFEICFLSELCDHQEILPQPTIKNQEFSAM